MCPSWDGVSLGYMQCPELYDKGSGPGQDVWSSTEISDTVARAVTLNDRFEAGYGKIGGGRMGSDTKSQTDSGMWANYALCR